MITDIETWVKVAAFAGSGLAMGLGAIGAAIGEGYTAAEANEAISRSPKSTGDIFNTMLIGQAIAESASIFAMVIAMLLLFTKFSGDSFITVAVLFSAGLCMGAGAVGSGLGSGFPAGEACKGISRQPGANSNIRMTMLIGTAIAQTPSIFALVTSLVLIFSNFLSRPVWPTVGGDHWGRIGRRHRCRRLRRRRWFGCKHRLQRNFQTTEFRIHCDQDDAAGAGDYGNHGHLRPFGRFYFNF